VVYDGNGEGLPAKRLVNALLKENKVPKIKLLKGTKKLEGGRVEGGEREREGGRGKERNRRGQEKEEGRDRWEI
jgi:hypothetical protein